MCGNRDQFQMLRLLSVNTCCFEFRRHGNQAQLLLTAKTFDSSTKSISVTFEINPSKKLGNLSGLGHVTQMVEQ